MKEIFKNKKLLIRLSYMLSILVMGYGYKIMNNYRGKAYILEHSIDQVIPFSSFFSIPYLLWYYPLLLIVGVYYGCNNVSIYKRLLFSINLGMFLCFAIYYFYPTTVPRPLVESNDIFSWLVVQIYKKDNPYNCFPSIHVLKSALIAMYANVDKDLSITSKVGIWMASITIILSTMFVKQHYFYDIISGLVLALGLYYTANYFELKGYLSISFLKNKLSSLKQGVELRKRRNYREINK